MGKDSRGTCQASFVLTAISLFGRGFHLRSMYLSRGSRLVRCQGMGGTISVSEVSAFGPLHGRAFVIGGSFSKPRHGSIE
jgi:hypothetical protein